MAELRASRARRDRPPLDPVTPVEPPVSEFAASEDVPSREADANDALEGLSGEEQAIGEEEQSNVASFPQPVDAPAPPAPAEPQEDPEELLDELRTLLDDDAPAAAPAAREGRRPRPRRPRPTRPGATPSPTEGLSALTDTGEDAPQVAFTQDKPLPRPTAEEDEAAATSRAPLGFAVSVLIFASAFGLYVVAPGLSNSVPLLAPVLDAYVAGVNQLRLSVQGVAGGMMP
jgi:hypothetical protein